MLSEEKQRILILERVIHFHILTLLFYRHCISQINHYMHLFIIMFQTLHMKEEENKRLSQRLVSILIYLHVSVCVCVQIFVLALALIFHLNVLII